MSKLTVFISAAVIALCLAGCAARPDTAVIDYATSEAEAEQRYADCMKEKGWEPSINPGGGVTIESHKSQLDRQMEDREECNSRPEMQSAPWTDEDWEDYYVELSEAADCLTAAGYDVPEKPSLQVFLDQSKDLTGDGTWYPYENIPDNEFITVSTRTCPEPDGF